MESWSSRWLTGSLAAESGNLPQHLGRVSATADAYMCCTAKSAAARVHTYANEMLMCTQVRHRMFQPTRLHLCWCLTSTVWATGYKRGEGREPSFTGSSLQHSPFVLVFFLPCLSFICYKVSTNASGSEPVSHIHILKCSLYLYHIYSLIFVVDVQSSLL